MNFLTIFEVFEDKISALVAEVTAKNTIIPRVFIEEPCDAISKGQISHSEDFLKLIQKMRNRLDQKLGFPVQSIFLTIHNLPIESKVLLFTKKLNEPRPIKKDDIEETLSKKNLGESFEAKTILHSFPLRYKLDERLDIENPEGLIGQNLGIACHFISISSQIYQSYLHIFRKADIRIEKIIDSSYATALNALSSQAKKDGSLLIHFQKNSIELIAYEKNTPLFLHQFPFGIDLMAKDIQTVLRIQKTEARYLLRKYGRALILSEDHLKNATLPLENNENRSYSLLEITRITSARIKETLKLIFLFLEKKRILPHVDSITFSGENCTLPLLNQLGYNIFHKPVLTAETPTIKDQKISHAIHGILKHRAQLIKTQNNALAYHKKSSNRTFELLRKFIKENL